MVPISDENCKPFWSMFSGRMTEIPPPSPLLSKDEGLRDIEHIMSIGNLILGVNSVTVSYLIHYDSLLQSATAILLQNVTEGGKVKHELLVTSYEFKSTNYEFKSASSEFKFTSYEFKFTSYEFKCTS